MAKVSESEKFLQNILRATFTFCRAGGQPKDYSGTCFLVSERIQDIRFPSFWTPKLYLVTNRHNVDFVLIEGESAKGFMLVDISVLYRDRESDNQQTTVSISIDQNAKIYVDSNCFNDIALIEFEFSDVPTAINCNLPLDNIAADLSIERVEIGEAVSFIGFPGAHWDAANDLPILRQASIASSPNLRYKNESQSGEAERILVSGMSFAGSSGSPVFRMNSRTIIGVMAGHYKASEQVHSGLSYFIKSSVILDILKTKTELPWGWGKI